MIETPSAKANSIAADQFGSESTLFDWALLPLFMVMTPLIYLFRIKYNLPLAANVDERTGLEVLQHFQNGSLNPHFFMYPTLYYYVTYFFTKLFPASMILLWGRILNLSFVGLTAFLAYTFCRIYFQSRAAGILSAIFIVTSETILNSGSYVCTDALLAAGILSCMHLLVRYFEARTQRNWVVAMLVLGFAIGCKYTAFLVFVAYVIADLIYQWNGHDHDVERGSDSRIPRDVLTAAFAVLSAVLLVAACAFPLDSLMRFAVAHHTNPDLKSSLDYLAFFHHVRVNLVLGGSGLLIMAILTTSWPPFYRTVSRKRHYAGLAIVVLVALLTTPYSVIDSSKFIYDLGAQARATVMLQNGQAQWSNYFAWLMRDESKILLILGLLGFAMIALRNHRRYLIIVVFTTLYFITIGRAHIGFPRYLTPILPVIYVLAAGFLIQLWRLQKPVFPYAKVLTAALLVVASAEVAPKLEASRVQSRKTDAFSSSYHLAMNMRAEKVLYAGYAPAAELRAAGIPAFQTSWASLGSKPMGSQLQCSEVLIFDRREAEDHHLAADRDTSVVVLLDDRSGDYGQEVLRRADCK
jgi:hypothetical protein